MTDDARDRVTVELVMFDLDGTLLDPGRRVHARNREVIARLMQHGVRVGFATGRPPKSAQRFVDELAVTGPLICMNGGLTWSVPRRAAVARRELAVDDAAAALRAGAELDIHANLYIDDDIFIARETDTSRASAEKDGVQQQAVGDLAAFLRGGDHAPIKILFIAPPARLAQLHDAVRARDPRNVLVNSEPDYLEMLPPGTSKGAALDELGAELGIPRDNVCAFGDNLNDLELIERAGLGVAMANAHEELRARADVVIGDNEGDAIARFIDKTFAFDRGAVTRPRS